MNRSVISLLVGVILAAGAVSAVPAQAAPTAEQRKTVKAIEAAIIEAAQLFKERKFKESADAIRKVEADLEKLAAAGDKDMLLLLKQPHSWLNSAHINLELEGFKLPPLKPLVADAPPKPAPTPVKPQPTGVSFTNEVAPMLVNRCGKCHIDKASGKFSMVDFATLMKGPAEGVVIFPKDPVGSRMVEVIEEGDMPRGGGKLTPAEFTSLKKWIAEGAVFDGDSPQTNLARLKLPGDTPVVATTDLPTSPTDDGPSFARDVAPVLATNCNGCHVNAQQVRGGLNMTTFQGLLRGGDTEPPVKAGDAAGSLLIQKLKGTADGQRMPVGRDPLPNDVIAKIEDWINAGAKFDGGNPDQPIQEVAALAKASMSTHEQLSADRQEKAKSNWALAMANVPSYTAETENFFLIGNVGENTLADYGKVAEEVAPKVAAIFKAPANQPLVKGRLTLFLFKQRYDYSEFGGMVEKRAPPDEWRGHWDYTVVDAYGAIIPPRTDEYSAEVLIAQQLAGAYVASLGKMPPRWFAEGAARVVASRLGPDDPRVLEWDEELAKVVATMRSPDDFLTGKLAPEAADIASYSFVSFLMDKSKEFDLLIKAMRNGEDFDKSFSLIYGGSPVQVSAVWAQKAARSKPKKRTFGG